MSAMMRGGPLDGHTTGLDAPRIVYPVLPYGDEIARPITDDTVALVWDEGFGEFRAPHPTMHEAMYQRDRDGSYSFVALKVIPGDLR